MTQFRDYETRRQMALGKPPKEAIKCLSCGCEWFEQIEVMKYDMNTIVTLHQSAPRDPLMSHNFHLLKCVKCSALQELPLNLSGSMPKVQDEYSELTEVLQKT